MKTGASLGAAAVLLAACHTSTAAPPADTDAGDDAAVPCDTPSGISKGPWVLGVDETSAKIRWEACRTGTTRGITITPETGGASLPFTAIETPTLVTTTSLGFGAVTDYAGTWYMQEASATGLTRATCYTYALAADAAVKGRFCTARAPGDAIRFMAIGDTNPRLGDSTTHVLANALPKNPDFIVHGGDIQYYDSTIETWASWFPLMAPLLRQGAMFPAIGNHESETPTEFVEYTTRFFRGAGFDGTDSYYRFESGGVWFFSVDTQEPLDPASVEGQWLVASLADASKKPGFRFSIVFMHKPFVTCGDTGDDPASTAYFAPIFKQYKVPLVFQAHMHGYERFELPDGMTYVTSAGGGGKLGDVNQNVGRAYCTSRVASGAFFHATIVDVDASGIHGTVSDDQGKVRDTFSKALP